MGYACGYNIYEENHAVLQAGAQSASQFTFGTVDPTSMKPNGLIDVVTIENQQHENACAGHAITTDAEVCLYLQSGGVVKPQLSRQFAYVNGQKANNITGDNGACLEGCLQSGRDVGFCLEELAPYTGQYYTQFSKEAYADAKSRTLKSYAAIAALQEAYECIARRVGAIFLGIPCTDEIFNSPSNGLLEFYNPSRTGGHALAIVDICDEKDDKGMPYFLLANSWGTQYGFRGFRKVRPSAFLSMLRCSYTSCYAVSEMSFLKPRYDWESQKWHV